MTEEEKDARISELEKELENITKKYDDLYSFVEDFSADFRRHHA